ncbi:hypothetical protein ACQPU1_09770 [Clostridium paraputrificum]|uniref:hypothetical protein n=1 Tax=Clostridium paraputrificum TaxID=29363 RepID=UPI003D359441
MKKILEDYIGAIKKLPLKDKYTKEEILIDEFLIERCKDIEIYYATHNEYINPKARVFIVGITPGFQQMSDSIAEARKSIEENIEIEEIKYLCKVAGRFSGPLRKNIISMLDEIKLNEALGVRSTSELFDNSDNLLHTISLIPYPVFVKGKNYTGHSPKLIKSDILMKYVYENFVDEVKRFEEIMIIPLGKAVEEVLEILIKDGVIREEQVLRGFPHPSGANVNRLTQLESNKKNLIKFIKEYKIKKE